jgi:H+/gluconate symporter-like permease
MAVLAAAFDGGVPLLPTYTQVFMRAAGDFIVPFFPLFLLGAVLP